MATIVDPRDELAGLEADLAKAKEEHSRAAIAAVSQPELNGNVDRLHRNVVRLSTQVDAIKELADSPAAARMVEAKRAERLRRNGDGEAFVNCLLKATEIAKTIDTDLRFSLLGPAIAQLQDNLAETRSLWLGWVNEQSDVRTANRSDNIRQMLGASGAGTDPIAMWLEVAAYRANMTPEAPTAMVMSMFPPGTMLCDVVTARAQQALKHAPHEFPELGPRIDEALRSLGE